MKNIIRIAAASLALGLCTSAVHAGHSSSNLTREAHRIVDYSEDLKCEVVRHFRHTREYRHLLSDADKIRAEARRIDSLSHRVNSLEVVKCIRADIEDLDDLVHHVADLIEEVDRCSRRSRSRSHRNISHVKRLVDAMNCSLHSMERTVDDLESYYRSRSRCDRDSRYSNGRHYEYRSSSRSTGERIALSVLHEVLRRR